MQAVLNKLCKVRNRCNRAPIEILTGLDCPNDLHNVVWGGLPELECMDVDDAALTAEITAFGLQDEMLSRWDEAVVAQRLQ